MNKSAIRNFAIWARVQLIEAAKQRAYLYEITDKGVNDPNAEIIGGKPITKEVRAQRKQLIAEINRKGFTQVMEEAAYTWFNRFIALRFMEVNGYLPTKVRVFTNENGEFKPDILREAMTIDLPGIDREQVLALLDRQDNEALFKLLIIAQCNALSEALPNMFETIANWTELLFPGKLLKEDGVIGQMVTTIPEEDWQDAIQIVGWLYQYYNTELKDETFALLKKNVKITKERIPSATQLFTPDWIVRYMVENSLGRLWVEGHPNDELKANWKYYLEEAEQEPQVAQQLAEIRKGYAAMSPEDIRIIDPCMGSGHILVYAFDVLMQIYRAAGYTDRDAVACILSKNLWGLDIDSRAAQLAYFAVMMKARQYDRRVFSREVRPHVMEIVDSKPVSDGVWECFGKLKPVARQVYDTFLNGKEYGSIIKVDPALLQPHMTANFTAVSKLDELRSMLAGFPTMMESSDLVQAAYLREAYDAVKPLVDLAQILGQLYDVVVTNPPYMGASGMSAKLSDFVKNHYPDTKSDMSTVCMEKALAMCKPEGYMTMVNIPVWMFLSSYEKMRGNLNRSTTYINMVHPGRGIFGSDFGAVSFVIANRRIARYNGTYCRLFDEQVEVKSPEVREEQFLSGKGRHIAQQDNFVKIPGMPVAYWCSSKTIDTFDRNPQLGSVIAAVKGLDTCDNDTFIRAWFEPNMAKIGLNIKHTSQCTQHKWFPYCKGGDFRRWYGNYNYVVNWENDGIILRNLRDEKGKIKSRPQNIRFYFNTGLTWSSVTSGKLSLRYMENSIFGGGGSAMFSNENIKYILGFMNSNVVAYYLNLLNPTINILVGDMLAVPYKVESDTIISKLVDQNIQLSKGDWDSFETSWDFQQHPLIIPVPTDPSERTIASSCGDVHVMRPVEYAYSTWMFACEDRFNQLKANEEELNRIFIDIYGLQDELTPDVADKDVTVRKADLQRDIKSLISYAVGCMMGRYSLDKPGLCFAGGSWEAYIRSEEGQAASKTYAPDVDGVLPITDDEYFGDDIVTMFEQFIKTAYGADTLEENLKFIANALDEKSHDPARSVIRNYFLNDFYADHCSTYSVTGSGKRPIYWLFDSGKKNGFKCLIYMHRYQPDTIARIRTDYIHEQQSRYRTAIADMTDRVEGAAGSERVKLNKQLTKLKDQELELRKYEEKIHHLADQMIPIDLDDGVKVNYAKFEDVLAKIK